MAYAGSSFHMQREGVYEKYKSYAISEKQESEWTAEFRDQQFAKFEANPRNANPLFMILTTLPISTNLDTIVRIVKLVEKKKKEMDSFTKLLCAEQFQELYRKHHYLKKKVKEMFTLSEQLLDEVLADPENIASEYKNAGYLSDVLNTETINRRALDCQASLTN